MFPFLERTPVIQLLCFHNPLLINNLCARAVGDQGLVPVTVQARTEMVFLLDVDFVPSEGLHASMAGKPATLQTTLLEGQLIVIPAFELNNGSAAQTVASTGKAALQSLYATVRHPDQLSGVCNRDSRHLQTLPSSM